MRVLDASALLAYVFNESGAEVVQKYLPQSVVHVVNYAELLSKLAERGVPAKEAISQLDQVGVLKIMRIDEGTLADAAEVATLRPLTKSLGLSLGDRYCLALAKRLNMTALTADKDWAKLDIGVQIELIR